MQKQLIINDEKPVEVTFNDGCEESLVVVFSAGAGGLPERYASLLDVLIESGCTLIAPHFTPLASPQPTEAELLFRSKVLSEAIAAFASDSAKVVGVGHSISASILLAMSGAQMWLGPQKRLNIIQNSRISRLVMIAPPTGFFRAPGSLDRVESPIQVWGASEDTITPWSQMSWLDEVMPPQCQLDMRLVNGAGHFSFMDIAPPHAKEPLSNKNAFLVEFSNDVRDFLIA